ncbi:13238_t:CDS:2 [Entrophospora sp. SA101]|nr:13238_t:CDS:2 [Entrophospora sp. SA101]
MSFAGSTNKSSCPNSIIKMWVLLEGQPRAIKLKADLSEVEDLDDFAPILKREFEELKNVKNQNIVFLDNNNTLLSPDTCLQTLAYNTTAKTPLLVRYSLSNANSKCKIPHTSGSLSLLREEVVKRFKEIQTEEFYFFNDETKEEIRNEYSFNILVSQTELNSNNYNLKLKVKVEGKRSYSDWELKDVFKEILRRDYKSLGGMPRFNLNDLLSLEHPFTENELKSFVDELQKTLNAFKKEFGINEETAREYISTFMKTAFCHIQDYINESAQLSVEIDLEGSRGYGPVDYMVVIIKILVLLCEAKAENMNKGTAQVLVQMHSAIEQQLGKRKHGQMEQAMFGIVTTGKLWRFVRWTGSLEEPTVHISEEYTCNFKGNMEPEKEVLRYIAQILQAQAMAFGVDDKDSGHPSKRQYSSSETKINEEAKLRISDSSTTIPIPSTHISKSSGLGYLPKTQIDNWSAMCSDNDDEAGYYWNPTSLGDLPNGGICLSTSERQSLANLVGIPRYFYVDHAEIPLTRHKLHTKSLIRLLLILRNIMIVNKSLLIQALEQASAHPPRNVHPSTTVSSPPHK